MATNASVILKFSDGTITYLRNAVTEDTLTEVKTDNSGILNIAGNLSAGQANQNKVCTHAAVKVQKDSSADGAFSHAAFYGVQGEILCLIQGMATTAGGYVPLAKPVRMTTGVTVKVLAQERADTAQIASLAVYCASGKSDIFTATASDGANVAMTNKDGNTIGEALVGQTVQMAYATYPATNGLADTGVSDGINALFVEDSQGQLKAMFYTVAGTGAGSEGIVPYQMQSFRVDQNDTLTVRANL